ncbi:glycosyltransferase family 39 protein [Microvirga sp. W0021]|uniref:Glycosyltransferase family 39 protein n=1 Tax=Hohaiivirga grylli TaxID=3133970 RepID=A0ABV0BK91_9HYPH
MANLTPFSHIGDAGDQGWVERFLSWVERGHGYACAALVALCLMCFLPGFSSLQPMDRDEPRFAQATKQMLETGDLVDIRFQDEARHKKPVGIYWIQASVVAAAEALGVPEAKTTIALYRLPSLLGAIGGVLLSYWAALAFLSRRGAFLAASLVAASIILMVESKLAKTDATLLACSMAVMGGLARAYLGQGSVKLPVRTCVVFWLGMAIGILVKGPMVVMFAGLTSVCLIFKDRSAYWLRSLRFGWGLLATLIIVLPWFIAIAIKSHGEFFQASVGQDMLAKVAKGQEVHGAPPGFYIIAFFATFWPGAILAAIAVPFAWTNRHIREVAFCLAWIVPSWIIFEAVPTKLPHYVMPLYPAIAIVVMLAVSDKFIGPNRPLARLASWVVPLIPLVLAVGLLFASISFDKTIAYSGFAVTLFAAAMAFVSRNIFVQGRVVGSILTSLLASVLVAVGVFGFFQHDLQSLKISPRLAEAAKEAKCPTPVIGTLGYREPSLVFLTGTDLNMLDGAQDAADFMKKGGCRVVFVDNRYNEAFRMLTEEQGIKLRRQVLVSGFNINGGKRIDIFVYETAYNE